MKARVANNPYSRPLLAALLVIAVLSLSGCGWFKGSPRKTPEENFKVRAMAPPEDKALVYVFRNAVWGTSLGFDLTANGHELGQTVGLAYHVLEVKPGKLILTSRGNSTSLFSLLRARRFGFKRLSLEMTVEAGKKYYVHQDITKWEPATGLRLMKEEDGRKGLRQCRLIDVIKLALLPPPKIKNRDQGQAKGKKAGQPGEQNTSKSSAVQGTKMVKPPAARPVPKPAAEQPPAKPAEEAPPKSDTAPPTSPPRADAWGQKPAPTV